MIAKGKLVWELARLAMKGRFMADFLAGAFNIGIHRLSSLQLGKQEQ